MLSQELDFHLIRQKDHILSLVNDEKYEEALTLLKFVEPFWLDATYGYKVAEIRERIRREILSQIMCATHWKTEKKWRKMLATV